MSCDTDVSIKLRTLIILVIGLLVVGCETLTPTMKSVAGTYGGIVWHENGIYEYTAPDGRKVKHKWEIVKGELHVIRDDQGEGFREIYRVNEDKSLTAIGSTVFFERTDLTKEQQDKMNWKRCP